MNIRINQLCLYIVLRLNLVASLDPSGYGINQEQLAQANSGYKAAYAKAKQMREIHFANKAASGDIGPTEEIMQETYQVNISEKRFSQNQAMFLGEIHHTCGATNSIMFLYWGFTSGLCSQSAIYSS